MRTSAVGCLSFLVVCCCLVPVARASCISLEAENKSLQLVGERYVDIVFSVPQDCPFTLIHIWNSTNGKEPVAYCQFLPGECTDRDSQDCYCLKTGGYNVRVYGTGMCCHRKQAFDITVTLLQGPVEKETVTVYENYGGPELRHCPSGVVEGSSLTCQCRPSSSNLWTHRPEVTWTLGQVEDKLHLSDVRREQDGETHTCYQYRGGWNTSVFASVSYSLNVYYPPESPYFLHSDGGNLSLRANQPDTIFCQAKGGNPPVQARSLSVVCEGVDNSAEQTFLKDKVWTLTLTFTPRFPTHHGMICTCSVTTVTPRGDRFLKETNVTVTEDVSSVDGIVIAGGATGGLVIIIVVIIVVIVAVKQRRGRFKAARRQIPTVSHLTPIDGPPSSEDTTVSSIPRCAGRQTLARGFRTPIDGPPSSEDANIPSIPACAKRQKLVRGYLTPMDGPPSSEDTSATYDPNSSRRQTSAHTYELIDEPPSSEDTNVCSNRPDAEPQGSSDVSLMHREGRPPSKDSQGYTCIDEIELATTDDGYLAPVGQRQDSSDSRHRLQMDSVAQRAEFSVQPSAAPPVPSFPPPQINTCGVSVGPVQWNSKKSCGERQTHSDGPLTLPKLPDFVFNQHDQGTQKKKKKGHLCMDRRKRGWRDRQKKQTLSTTHVHRHTTENGWRQAPDRSSKHRFCIHAGYSACS